MSHPTRERVRSIGKDGNNGKPVGRPQAATARVIPGLFQTLQVPIVMRRANTEQDNAGSILVAVINEAFAKRIFKGHNPLGRRFGNGGIQPAND